MGCYEELREGSTDQIVLESILCADTSENLEELPISRTIQIKKAVNDNFFDATYMHRLL